jgi:transposase
MIEALAKRSAGLDVHKRTVVCTVLIENAHGQIEKQTREFGTFRKELNKLAEWLSEFEVEIAVMESTGIYWKSVYEALERKEVKACVVNARHVKNVPGRKTDVQDSEWLAELARCGLLRASFIPPHDLRELRLLTRYRGKLVDLQFYFEGYSARMHASN